MLFEQDLEAYINEPNNTHYEVKMASIDDLYPLAQIMKCSPKYVIKRFYQTHKCFVAYYAGEIVHHSWVSFTDSGGVLDSHVFKLENGSACIFESYTKLPDTNVFAAYNVLLHIQNYLLINKQSKVYLTVRNEDLSVKIAAKNLGFCPNRCIKTVRLLGKKLITKIVNIH